MKKILLCFILAIGLNANVIELTVETASNYGNPFKQIFVKKTETKKVYSEPKDVILKVEVSGIDSNGLFGKEIAYPKEFILKNETITNVSKIYYGEDYNVLIGKGDIEVNVLSGTVYLTFDEVQNTYLLKKTEVELMIEVIYNGVKQEKKVRLDHTLNKERLQRLFIVTSNSFKLDLKTIDVTIEMIIETQIYNILRGDR